MMEEIILLLAEMFMVHFRPLIFLYQKKIRLGVIHSYYLAVRLADADCRLWASNMTFRHGSQIKTAGSSSTPFPAWSLFCS